MNITTLVLVSLVLVFISMKLFKEVIKNIIVGVFIFCTLLYLGLVSTPQEYLEKLPFIRVEKGDIKIDNKADYTVYLRVTEIQGDEYYYITDSDLEDKYKSLEDWVKEHDRNIVFAISNGSNTLYSYNLGKSPTQKQIMKMYEGYRSLGKLPNPSNKIWFLCFYFEHRLDL